MRISVCIPTVRPTTLEAAIRSVCRQTFSDWELVVVGQGEGDQLRAATERASAGDPRVRYRHLRRRGLSIARNAGLEEARGEIVAFMDDDCEAEHDWLEQLDRCFVPDVAFVSGSVVAPVKSRRGFAACPGFTPSDVIFDPSDDPTAYPGGFGSLGANIAVRRQAAARVGGFDEALGAGACFQGGEEHDFVYRLALTGAKMRSTTLAVVRHTYGARYGVRAVYAYKRERLRGDGAGAAKRALLDAPEGGMSVPRTVRRAAIEQLETLSLPRLPFAALRLFHYLTSYRECLRDFALSETAFRDPALALLVPRTDDGPRVLTARPVAAIPS